MMFEYTSFTRRAPALGKCPDCYGEGHRWIDPIAPYREKCRLCDGTGLVSEDVLAQRESEYRAWLKRRVAKKPRRK